MSSPAKLPHFTVDKQGLAEMLSRKSKSFVVTELVSNSWDEASTVVEVSLEWLGNGRVKVVVEDDNPEGFANLAHAYTLFARSTKRENAEQRGRFNLGEKLVVAVCDSASIQTTKGTVIFDSTGRSMTKARRKSGSVFTGVLKMSRAEYDEAVTVISTLIPPAHVQTTFNFALLPTRVPVREFEESLRTEIADADGRLKATTRKTRVALYEPLAGEVATLYEMGIPVVELGDRYHVDVQQKVPLNTDRDNVTPAFLRDVRTAVLNSAHAMMSAEDMQQSWVVDALQDDAVEADAVKSAIKGRFGEKSVAYDPSDPEANKIAMEHGYTVIPGGALPKKAWANVKSSEVALPAGKVTPSPQVHGDEADMQVMDPDHYPDAVREVVEFSKVFAEHLINRPIMVRVVSNTAWPFAATYGPAGELTLNFGRLGYKWFAGDLEPIVDLLIHELAHQLASDHLDRAYLNALTKLGARAVKIALESPDVFVIREAVAA